MKKCNLRFFSPQKMKKQLALALAISLICAVPVSVFAQVLKVSIKKNNVSIETVLQELEKQSGYTFFYNDNQVKLNKKVSVNATEASVEEVLNQALKNSGYTYKIVENQIVISTANTANGVQATKSTQQQKKQTIKGVVKDAMGEPIIGASVVEKGASANGTITNIDGEFTLSVSGGELQVTYIGYMPQTISLKPGTTSYNVTMREDTKTLDEVVVVGYTTQKRESLTGAMQVVDKKKLLDITSPSTENFLASKVPGVQVTAGSGQPGTAGKIVIRGKATVNGATDPLWVIDGVIVGSGANNLNPADIESISVLKDAASTAIYGSMGANGVIVVTTKRGVEGKPSVNVSIKAGISNLHSGNLEMMNGEELYDYYSSFSNYETAVKTKKWWNEDLRNRNFGWFDNVTHTGVMQDYNVAISGGSDKIKTYTSVGYYNETGAVKGYEFTRYNFRFNVEYDAFKWLKIKPKFFGARRDIMDQQASISAAYDNFPWDYPYDENGELVGNRPASWVNGSGSNYMYDLQWNYDKSTHYEAMANFDFDIKFTDWLTFSSVNNYKYGNTMKKIYVDPRSISGQDDRGRVGDDKSSYYRIYSNQILKYNQVFNKHSINALLGYEWNTYNGEATSQVSTGFAPDLPVADVGANPNKAKGSMSEWAVQSYMFNANYSYDNRYLAQVSFRADGASNFGKEAKYGCFYSISAGWNINREAWFNSDWVDQLKLRASFGTVGSRPDALYPQYDLYSLGNYNGSPAALISQIGNKNLTWEKTQTIGVGVDVRVFDRVSLTLDYYKKKTNDLLYSVPLPAVTGITGSWRNVGSVKNNGFEASLQADIIKTKNWNWGISANLGLNRNKVEKLYGSKQQIIIGGANAGVAGVADKVMQPGYDIDTWYTVEWGGVNSENGAPQWFTTDTSGKRVLTSNYSEAAQHPVMMGTSNPDFYGGFSTNLSWKNIDLSAVFAYSVGGKIFSYNRTTADSDGAYTYLNQMKLKDGWSRWEKPGDIATHPVATYGNGSQSNKVSSRYLENASYLRLRNLTIGYNLPLKKWSISNARIFFSADNLFVISDYSGIDPEIAATNNGKCSGVDVSNYPQSRKFSFGLNVTF